MGLFDFFKSKKNPLDELLATPEARKRIFLLKLENLQKRVANLKAVGRGEESSKAVAEFMNDYVQESKASLASPQDLARLSYFLAYEFLPDFIYQRWDEFLRYWNDGIPFPIYLALQGAVMLERRITPQQLGEFKAQMGQLSADVDYHLLKFPSPPVLGPEIDDLDIKTLLAMREANQLVLGPYFAAVLSNHSTGERQVHILHQDFGGRTVLRRVTAEGMNLNCGIGPEPLAKSFLESLK